jgi:hypothetical protein
MWVSLFIWRLNRKTACSWLILSLHQDLKRSFEKIARNAHDGQSAKREVLIHLTTATVCQKCRVWSWSQWLCPWQLSLIQDPRSSTSVITQLDNLLLRESFKEVHLFSQTWGDKKDLALQPKACSWDGSVASLTFVAPGRKISYSCQWLLASVD